MIPKKFRLSKSDTEWVLKKGAQLTTDLFIIRFLKSTTVDTTTPPQFTIVTSAKLSKKAVERNLLKRRIYEAIRLNLNQTPGTVSPELHNMKIAIIPKKRALEVEYLEIDTNTKALLKKLTKNNE